MTKMRLHRMTRKKKRVQSRSSRMLGGKHQSSVSTIHLTNKSRKRRDVPSLIVVKVILQVISRKEEGHRLILDQTATAVPQVAEQSPSPILEHEILQVHRVVLIHSGMNVTDNR